MKRIFKGPWIWIVVAVIGVLVALQFLAPSGGYDEVPTSDLESYIAKGEVKDITFIDGDQQIQATLDTGTRKDGDKIMTHYILGQQTGIIDRVDAQVEAGKISESNSKNPQPSALGSIFLTLLPILLIVGLVLLAAP